MVRILDLPPYNHFLLSCTARAEAAGERVSLPLTISWIKRVQIGGDVRFTPVESEQPSQSLDPADGYLSILRGSETDTEGSISYRCRASFLRDIGGASGLRVSNTLIAVAGSHTQTADDMCIWCVCVCWCRTDCSSGASVSDSDCQ